MKICRTCLQEKTKSKEFFYVRKELKDGFMSSCKQCVDERNKLWSINNAPRRHSKRNDRSKVRRQRNLEKIREQERASKLRSQNKDPVAFGLRKRQDSQTRRARFHEVFVEKVIPQEVFLRDYGICYLCQLPVSVSAFHLDHVIPISRGGTHSYANVKITHPLCNLAKGSKIIGSDTQVINQTPMR